jgi:hypothetical protein
MTSRALLASSCKVSIRVNDEQKKRTVKNVLPVDAHQNDVTTPAVAAILGHNQPGVAGL